MTTNFEKGNVIGGRYRLEAELGGGGFGTVWQADDTRQNKTVAVKVPKYGNQQQATVDKYFLREKDALDDVRTLGGHPHIMDFEGPVTESGATCLVLEFVPGDELEQFIATNGTMDSEQMREFGIALCDAMAFLHEKVEVMYRDLKPDNVLISSSSDPVLIDFTTAKEIETDIPVSASPAGSSSSADSDDSVIGGGNRYKPPEITGDADVPQGPWSDVYSIGRLLLYAATKLAPQNKPYGTAPGDLGMNVDSDIDEIITRATHEDPTERYGSAAALKRALETESPEPPKHATLTRVRTGDEHTIHPGDTIGRANAGPRTNVSLDEDHVSKVHCRFDLDENDNWVLLDKSTNGTYVNHATPPVSWRYFLSDEGKDILRDQGYDDRVREAEGDRIRLQGGDTIALVDPEFKNDAWSWYRFEK